MSVGSKLLERSSHLISVYDDGFCELVSIWMTGLIEDTDCFREADRFFLASLGFFCVESIRLERSVLSSVFV